MSIWIYAFATIFGFRQIFTVERLYANGLPMLISFEQSLFIERIILDLFSRLVSVLLNRTCKYHISD
ncbi:hypothetical protein D3C80_1925420 [compost metagenome]